MQDNAAESVRRVIDRLHDSAFTVATDQGNILLDARFGPMPDPGRIAERLNARAGIVEHGLFIGLTHDVIVAGKDGIRHLTHNAGSRL